VVGDYYLVSWLQWHGVLLTATLIVLAQELVVSVVGLSSLLFFLVGIPRLASEDLGVLIIVPRRVASELIHFNVPRSCIGG
jgi:hypothetical protein